MKFVPAGEIIGDAHRVRTVRIAQSPQLPDGEYSFFDMYCSDPGCDCRKTMIQVLHEGRPVSIINYGWETPSFYKGWMQSAVDDADVSSMAGASIDISSPDLVGRDGVLALFHALLNEEWIQLIKRHYRLVKSRQAAAPQQNQLPNKGAELKRGPRRQ